LRLLECALFEGLINKEVS